MKKSTLMLWNDTSKRSLDAKIKDAIAYYAKKYGVLPTVCTVHPSALEEYLVGKTHDGKEICGVSIRTHKTMLPCDFHIGYLEGEENGK